MIEDAPALSIQRREPQTALRGAEGEQLSTLGDFWAWAYSDESLDAEPRILPGYLVELALRRAPSQRWAGTGLNDATQRLLDSLTFEVRGASEVPTMARTGAANITFSLANRPDVDAWIFAIIAHTDVETLNPLDVRQWAFFVVPSVYIDMAHARARSITLTQLASTPFGAAVSWSELGATMVANFRKPSAKATAASRWSVA